MSSEDLEAFTSLASRISMDLSDHDISPAFECRYCSKTFEMQNALTHHMRSCLSTQFVLKDALLKAKSVWANKQGTKRRRVSKDESASPQAISSYRTTDESIPSGIPEPNPPPQLEFSGVTAAVSDVSMPYCRMLSPKQPATVLLPCSSNFSLENLLAPLAQ